MNVLSVHYRLNPQLWKFCQEHKIKLTRIRPQNNQSEA